MLCGANGDAARGGGGGGGGATARACKARPRRGRGRACADAGVGGAGRVYIWIALFGVPLAITLLSTGPEGASSAARAGWIGTVTVVFALLCGVNVLLDRALDDKPPAAVAQRAPRVRQAANRPATAAFSPAAPAGTVGCGKLRAVTALIAELNHSHVNCHACSSAV